MKIILFLFIIARLVLNKANDSIDISNYDWPKKSLDKNIINLGFIHSTDIHGHLLGI